MPRSLIARHPPVFGKLQQRLQGRDLVALGGLDLVGGPLGQDPDEGGLPRALGTQDQDVDLPFPVEAGAHRSKVKFGNRASGDLCSTVLVHGRWDH